MKKIEIVQAKTKEDCEICDNYLSKLINYESSFDGIINQNVLVNGPAENNIKQEDVFLAYAKTDVPIGYILGYRQFNKGKIYNKVLYVELCCRQQGVGKVFIWDFKNQVKNTL